MQIELIGCTSSGKSTLTKGMVQASREQGITTLTADDFVLKQIRLNWIKSHLLRTLLIHLVAFFACLVTWRKNIEFYQFAMRHLFHLPIAWLEKLYLFRNVLKKIGIFEIIRFRDTNQQVILVDEGVLQTAHNLFVHVSVHVKREQILTFARLIPLPDVIVYMRQSESLLLERVNKRGHKRIPNRSNGNVARFIKQAIATFDTLVQDPVVESRLLVVDSGQTFSTTANYQDDPSYDLALNIVRNGLITGVTNTRFETVPSH